MSAISKNVSVILQNQRGVALMAVLVMVVIMGLGAGIIGTTWTTKAQRSKEQELLWRGDQYYKAIASYCRGPGGVYPRSLDVLERDPRFLKPARHIRRLFKDPVTGEDFVLIKNAAGGIMGVHSSSALEPFKKDGFPYKYARFSNCKGYSEWEFIFRTESEITEPSQEAETAPQSSSP